LRDVSRKKKRRKKIKREEVGRLGQKWAKCGIGLGHIEEMGCRI
jgi:hypothetical protein